MAKFLLENLHKQFGLSDKIILDRGPQFALLVSHSECLLFSDYKDLYNMIDTTHIGGVPWQSITLSPRRGKCQGHRKKDMLKHTFVKIQKWTNLGTV